MGQEKGAMVVSGYLKFSPTLTPIRSHPLAAPSHSASIGTRGI